MHLYCFRNLPGIIQIKMVSKVLVFCQLLYPWENEVIIRHSFFPEKYNLLGIKFHFVSFQKMHENTEQV